MAGEIMDTKQLLPLQNTNTSTRYLHSDSYFRIDFMNDLHWLSIGNLMKVKWLYPIETWRSYYEYLWLASESKDSQKCMDACQNGWECIFKYPKVNESAGFPRYMET